MRSQSQYTFLRQLMLANALSYEQPKDSKRQEGAISVNKFVERNIGLLPYVVFVGGLLLVIRFHEPGTFHAIAEALMIAGLLAIVVDPVLKSNLFKESSRGIFVHLLGFELHPQVKDRLQSIIFNTKLIRETCELRYTIEPQDGYFFLTVEYDTKIINPTHTTIPFTPSMEFDMAHKAEIFEMSFTSSDGECKYHQKYPQLIEIENQPGVHRVEIGTFNIEPIEKNISYRGNGKYRIKSLYGYSEIKMGSPTLRLSIRVNAPEDYEVGASPSDVVNGNYYEYNNFRMPGEHVIVRWRKKGGEWL